MLTQSMLCLTPELIERIPHLLYCSASLVIDSLQTDLVPMILWGMHENPPWLPNTKITASRYCLLM